MVNPAGEFSELGFRRAFGSIGCSVPKDAELIGSFRGRIDPNLSEFMSIASQVPGLRPDILPSFGGGGEAARLASTIQKRSSFGFVSRLPLTMQRYIKENRNLTARVSEFEKWFEERKRRMQGMDSAHFGSSGPGAVARRRRTHFGRNRRADADVLRQPSLHDNV